MDIDQAFIRYFDRLSWTSFACYLKGSWKTSDKIKAFLVLLYTLEEAFRLCYVWSLTDMESSLTFFANFNAIPIVGRTFSLVSGMFMFELFALQLILWLNPKSILQLNSYMTRNNESSFNREARIIFKKSYWLRRSLVRFYHVVVINCGFYFIYYFSFSWSSICFSIFAVIIQMINMEIVSLLYMFYSLWIHSARKLSYSIGSLFIQDNSPISVHLNHFNQVWFHSQVLNQFSKRLSTIFFLFGCLCNTGLFLVVNSSLKLGDELILPVVIVAVAPPIAVFIERLVYFAVAATPLQETIAMQTRLYCILLHDKKISWKDRMKLLNIVKSQAGIRTKMALTTIDERLLETKFLGQYIFYSARVLVLLLKVIK